MTKIVEIKFDLDGVMADFDGGVLKLTGALPHEIGKKEMWKAIARAKTFFEDLEFMPDAMELWNYVHDHPLVKSGKIKTGVLTGLPTMNDGANQKRRWVAKKINEHVPVIVLPSKEKRLHAAPGVVLIDDRNDMIGPFVEAGGIGILHRSAVETIGQLKALGL
jgi:hypothetical protein